MWPWKVKVMTQDVYGPISRKRLEIESWLKWNTCRKCYMGYQMVTYPMTSRDPKRSRSWPRYIWSQISQKRLEIEAWFQWSTNRKPHMGNRIVTWSMTSRDLERSRSWPQDVYGPISQKRLEIVSYNGTPIGNAGWGIKWSHAQWRHVTPKGQSWPRYIGSQISRKRLEIGTWFQ